MYNDYFEEYVKQAKLEMYQYFQENDMEVPVEDDQGKSGVYKINFYYRDHLQIPKISQVLKKPRTQETLIEFVSSFIDTHYTQLRTSGPVYNFTFADKETSFFYDTFNTNKDELIEMFYQVEKEAFYGKISKFFEGWVLHAPHKLLLISILIDALQNQYNDVIECMEYILAFAEYPTHYREYWKVGVDEQTMNYTIEHLGSKFKIKKVNNLLGLLKLDGHVSIESHRDRLLTGADHVYTDFMHRIHNQFNNTYKNISRAYYDAIQAQATQHNKDAQFDDGTTADPEGFNTNIAQIVDKTINKFISGDINNGIVGFCAQGSDVDKNNLTNFINQIMKDKNNRIDKIIEDIITSYFQTNPSSNSVSTTEFIVYGLKLYRSISTSKNPIYQEIRQILTYWMENIINIRQYYKREATVVNYTRAIFNYMIFMIKHYN